MTISVPSYVVPGSYLENLLFLKANSQIRRVELLFFIYDAETRALVGPEWPEIRRLADRADPDAFRYTLHLPDIVTAEHQALIDLSCDFVDAYVVHPPRDLTTVTEFARLLAGWQQHYQPAFRLENTRLVNFDSALSALAAARQELGMLEAAPICADIGHLVLEGHEPLPWLERYQKAIEEVHLHGCDGQKDHIPLTGQEHWFKSLRPWLANFKGLVELELFAWQELKPIIAMLEDL